MKKWFLLLEQPLEPLQIVWQNWSGRGLFCSVICGWKLKQDTYAGCGHCIASWEWHFSKTTKFWSLSVLATGSRHGKETYGLLYPRLLVTALPPGWHVWSSSKHSALFSTSQQSTSCSLANALCTLCGYVSHLQVDSYSLFGSTSHWHSSSHWGLH